MPRIIYIHGFNSSPLSHKAQLLTQRMTQLGIAGDLIVPQLSAYPEQAMGQLQACVEGCDSNRPVLIGSSLGGYYAIWLAERYGLKAILINPAIYPYNLLREYLGVNQNFYTDERYILEPRHVQLMKSYEVEKIRQPEDYWLLLETGDDTLDYHEAENKFPDSRMTIHQGGSHEFLHFDDMLDDILRYCGYDHLKLSAVD